MARVTHVKRTQQRYETVPVIDEETGLPKKTPVMIRRKDRETGEIVETQKVTKKGRAVFMTVTEVDKSKPKPLYKCESCGKTIEVGSPHKHVSPKSGPYGGHKRVRCESCPTWQQWDLSNSLSAQLARISYDFWGAVDSAESPDDVQSALDDASGAIEEIAEQKRESASNIEEGFGHPTSSSEELEQVADDLEQWSSDVSSADIPEMTACEDCDDGQKDCDQCEGTGKVDSELEGVQLDCEECSGTGTVDCDNCDGTGDDIDAWRDEVRDAVTIVDESPV